MPPGRKKRFLQNEYRQDKAVDSARRDNVYNAARGNQDRTVNVLDDKESVDKETSSFKKYNNRKVVSNWNRYDETPDAGNEELRGEDYEVALTCSRGVVSQFRFEAEKEWEDESLQIDANDFISIDSNALASALGCIPFHKRLGIPEDVFTPEMVEEFYTSAACQRNSYVPPERSVGSHSQATSQLEAQHEVNTAIIESLKSCLNIKIESTSVDKERDLEKAAQKKVIDTELDFLLSLSESKEKSLVPEKINNLLQGDSTSATETKPCKSLTVPSSEMNIDDWLDSIVDD